MSKYKLAKTKLSEAWSKTDEFPLHGWEIARQQAREDYFKAAIDVCNYLLAKGE